MDWNTLLAVVLGGLIGIVTNYFSNRYQLLRWREERDEQRREAKIQAKEKWIERDILSIMESLENTVCIHRKARLLFEQIEDDKEKKKEDLTKTILTKLTELRHEAARLNDYMAILVKSFEGEFDIYFSDFSKAILGFVISPVSIDKSFKNIKNINIVIEKAGIFQRALREKLITIRDTD